MTAHTPFRIGKWLPSDQATLNAWLQRQISHAEKAQKAFHPVIEEFKDLIESDPELYMLFNLMFTQIPHKTPYNSTPDGKPQIRSYHHMLTVLNHILTTAPEYNKSGLVGFPINAILDWPMGTKAGFAAFLNTKVNQQLKKVLNAWGEFLSSPASTSVLTEDPHAGWFGENAHQAMPKFVEEFICDPSKPHYGFTSWDDFFTRVFRTGQRPIASPEDEDVIVNSCESAPFQIARDVKFRDKFWIKAQPYSLSHMFQNDALAEEFVGGTIYQAFLSATSYHRWHAPINGRVVDFYNLDGTYYSEPVNEGFYYHHHPDSAAPNDSQGYISQVAARGVIVIEADNPKIGRMAIVYIGMAEVSTCEFTVKIGQKVKKGDELGMFHFGGSTHCLVFGPHVNLEFDLHGQTPGVHSSNILVNQKIAQVK